MEKDYSKEVWIDVIGYDGFYKISNFGNIKKCLCKNQFGIFKIERTISPYKNEKGYLKVGFVKDKKRKIEKLHRVVAFHFLDNPENKPEINHKDGDKLNNHVSNLEWCTRSQNIKHSWENGLSIKRFGKDNHSSKSVDQFEIDGSFIRTWECMSDAGRANGISSSKICCVCKGTRITAGGFKWSYTNQTNYIL